MQTDNPHKVNLSLTGNGKWHYSGGKDGNGHLWAGRNAGSPVLFEIRVAGNNWDIFDVEIGDKGTQIVDVVIDGDLATITDLNTEGMETTYCVSVKDRRSGEVLRCDPMMSNEPRGGA